MSHLPGLAGIHVVLALKGGVLCFQKQAWFTSFISISLILNFYWHSKHVNYFLMRLEHIENNTIMCKPAFF